PVTREFLQEDLGTLMHMAPCPLLKQIEKGASKRIKLEAGDLYIGILANNIKANCHVSLFSP
ncbi:MAG: hypothetical protein LC670_12695, partial [Flavobacteriales bacterium]|nr:hypothetical protein [Flavobacteriales bacterium]